MTAGRPTNYKPEMCEQIIAVAKTGKLQGGWCRELGISKQSMSEYRQSYPEFADAYDKAFAIARGNMEQLAYDQASGEKLGNFNATKFLMSACLGYREKTEVENTHNFTDKTISFDDAPENQ